MTTENAKEKKWYTIIVEKKVKEALEILRKEFGAKSINEVISALILEFERARARKIKTIMCVDFRETSASYPAWLKLLRMKGLADSEIIDALKFLIGSYEDMKVDVSKCTE